jgi:tetrahydromethanopterin S-methyltransferase subunit G
MSNIENLMLEHMKKIQGELTGIRQDNAEVKSRLSSIESGIARITRDEAGNYGEIIENRHMFDKLKERVEKIERRLEIANG